MVELVMKLYYQFGLYSRNLYISRSQCLQGIRLLSSLILPLNLRADLAGKKIRVWTRRCFVKGQKFSSVRFKETKQVEALYHWCHAIRPEDIANTMLGWSTWPKHVNTIVEIMRFPREAFGPQRLSVLKRGSNHSTGVGCFMFPLNNRGSKEKDDSCVNCGSTVCDVMIYLDRCQIVKEVPILISSNGLWLCL